MGTKIVDWNTKHSSSDIFYQAEEQKCLSPLIFWDLAKEETLGVGNQIFVENTKFSQHFGKFLSCNWEISWPYRWPVQPA